jgi:predicted small secreted protein
MKHALLAASLVLSCILAGCGDAEGDPVGAGIGDSGISGGTGGTGSGPTGTGGGVPGENPAGDDIHSGGTGTNAPQ